MDKYGQITFDFFGTPPPEKPVEADSNGNAPIDGHNLSDSSAGSTTISTEPTENDSVTIESPELVDNADIIDFSITTTTISEDTAVIAKSTRGRKSLKSFDQAADSVQIPADESLFTKQYYSIGEVAQMFNVNPSLLRFWESEFDIIQPRKNKKGDRHFRPVDIKNLELIYDLLRRRKLTIEGARDYLKRNNKAKERYSMIKSLQEIRLFMLELKANL